LTLFGHFSSVRAVSLRKGALVAACAMALLFAWAMWSRLAGPPNVVLVTIDTLRPDRMGVYGYSRETTPNIERFFAAGTRFERATSSAPCTIPSVQQILTGTLDQHGERPTLAQRLAEAGYETAAFVSQHFFRLPKGPNPTFSRGFEVFDVQPWEGRDRHGMTRRTASEVSDRAIGWLRGGRGGTPFLLWLHYFDPHDPYDPPPEHDIYAEPAPFPLENGDWRAYLEDREDAPFDERETAFLRNRYDAEIRYTDAQLGRVFDELERLGMIDDSLVVLTSDHGEWLGETGRWGHCFGLHETELRVPLLARLRGEALGGRLRDDSLVSTLDVVPTALAVAGAPAAPELDGFDLRALPESRHAVAVWQSELSVRDRDWKLVVDDELGAPVALYNLAADPEEQENRVGEGSPELQRLEALAGGYEADVGNLKIPSLLRKLRALGYIRPDQE
jgi:arylsulfatase A-like enzyme